MKNRLMTLILTGLIAGSMISSSASAQISSAPGHAGVNHIDSRLNNQQNRIDHGVANGSITPRQVGRNERRDAHVAREEHRDMSRHNGHLTRHDRHHMNHELNHNSHRIHNERHGDKFHHRHNG